MVHRLKPLVGAVSGDDTVAWKGVMAMPEMDGRHSRAHLITLGRTKKEFWTTLFPWQHSTWTLILSLLLCGRGKLNFAGFQGLALCYRSRF